MKYDTDRNRVKVAKYRTRKGLREAGYAASDIDEIINGINWAIMTPQEVLNKYVDYDSLPTQDEQSEQDAPASPWDVWVVVGALGLMGAAILGGLIKAARAR